jgi:hypothetical protein
MALSVVVPPIKSVVDDFVQRNQITTITIGMIQNSTLFFKDGRKIHTMGCQFLVIVATENFF